MVVIGLGNAGCNIASLLKKHPQYDVVLLNVGINIPERKTVEEYEEKTPALTKYLKKVKGEVWFFVCGAEKVAGCTLRILEKIKHCDVNVVYINPDDMMNIYNNIHFYS